MIIPINENWRIQSDRYCWMVCEKRVYSTGKGKAAGRVDWESKLFYPTLTGAVRGLYQLRLRLSEAEGLEAALEDAQRFATELEAALAPKFRVVVGEETPR